MKLWLSRMLLMLSLCFLGTAVGCSDEGADDADTVVEPTAGDVNVDGEVDDHAGHDHAGHDHDDADAMVGTNGTSDATATQAAPGGAAGAGAAALTRSVESPQAIADVDGMTYIAFDGRMLPAVIRQRIEAQAANQAQEEDDDEPSPQAFLDLEKIVIVMQDGDVTTFRVGAQYSSPEGVAAFEDAIVKARAEAMEEIEEEGDEVPVDMQNLMKNLQTRTSGNFVALGYGQVQDQTLNTLQSMVEQSPNEIVLALDMMALPQSWREQILEDAAEEADDDEVQLIQDMEKVLVRLNTAGLTIDLQHTGSETATQAMQGAATQLREMKQKLSEQQGMNPMLADAINSLQVNAEGETFHAEMQGDINELAPVLMRQVMGMMMQAQAPQNMQGGGEDMGEWEEMDDAEWDAMEEADEAADEMSQGMDAAGEEVEDAAVEAEDAAVEAEDAMDDAMDDAASTDVDVDVDMEDEASAETMEAVEAE